MKSNFRLRDEIKLRGDLTIVQTNVITGRVRRFHVRNTITYDGLNSALYLWAQDGIIPGDFQMVKLVPGTSAVPPTRGDLGLGAPLPLLSDHMTLGPATRLVSPATGELVLTGTLGLLQANTAIGPLTEIGIILGNGQCFGRQVHAGFSKTNAFTLGYSWRLAMTA